MPTRPTWRYYFEFVFFPLVILATAAYYCRSWQWSAYAALGVLLWTLVEYWGHRSVLHTFFWHGNHERHHKHPHEFGVYPVWQMPLVWGAVFIAAPADVFCGLMIGYVWFLSLHHVLHHVRLAQGSWLHNYERWHDQHHTLTHFNYGVTTQVWDRVFGTYRSYA